MTKNKILRLPKMPKATIYIDGTELARILKTYKDISDIEDREIPLDKNMEVRATGKIGYHDILDILENITAYFRKSKAYEEQQRHKNK